MKVKLELILDEEEAQVIRTRAEELSKIRSATYEELVELYVFEHIADNIRTRK